MIVKKIQCSQFAGVTNRELVLDENMNVLVGKNESGKTTMLELIYHVLNTSVDLKRNEKKEYFDAFMPSDRMDGFSGDNIDGMVEFETEEGTFSIHKTWMKDETGFCRLIVGDGANIQNRKNVEDVMRKQLWFGQAVYRNLIFSSQKDREQILKGILQSSQHGGMKEAKEELASRITQTVMELDGVSLERLEEEIRGQIGAYESNWDSERKRPKAKAKAGGGRWEKNVGKILESYYRMQDLEEQKKYAEQAEQQYEKAAGEVTQARRTEEVAEEELREYQKYAVDIENRNQNEELTKKYREELAQKCSDQEKWPLCQKSYKALLALRQEWEQAKQGTEAEREYNRLQAHRERCERLQEQLKNTGEISQEDYKKVTALEKEYEELKASLKFPALKGKVKRQNKEYAVRIHQEPEENPVEISDGEFVVERAFSLEVPDVVEVEFTPEKSDSNEIIQQMKQRKTEQEEILLLYHVKNLESLEKKYEEGKALRHQLDLEKTGWQASLQGRREEEMEKAYEQATIEHRELAEIQREIEQYCTTDKIAETVGRLKSEWEMLEKSYPSLEELEKDICKTQERLDQLVESLENAREIPESFLHLTNPKQAGETFRLKSKQAEQSRKEKEALFFQCEKDLPEKSSDEIQLEWEEICREYKENQKMCQHWKHILEVFEATRDKMEQNPSAGILENARKYLQQITGETVTLHGENEGLDLMVYSHGNQMSYQLLSEGTKQTVALAFRLAVLENLYGGQRGFAVFDDALIDMDPQRREMAANLLKEFAKKHQVIYVTCDPQFAQLLGGKVISMDQSLLKK